MEWFFICVIGLRLNVGWLKGILGRLYLMWIVNIWFICRKVFGHPDLTITFYTVFFDSCFHLLYRIKSNFILTTNSYIIRVFRVHRLTFSSTYPLTINYRFCVLHIECPFSWKLLTFHGYTSLINYSWKAPVSLEQYTTLTFLDISQGKLLEFFLDIAGLSSKHSWTSTQLILYESSVRQSPSLASGNLAFKLQKISNSTKPTN